MQVGRGVPLSRFAPETGWRLIGADGRRAIGFRRRVQKPCRLNGGLQGGGGHQGEQQHEPTLPNRRARRLAVDRALNANVIRRDGTRVNRTIRRSGGLCVDTGSTGSQKPSQPHTAIEFIRF